jgi:hypothetical protein
VSALAGVSTVGDDEWLTVSVERQWACAMIVWHCLLSWFIKYCGCSLAFAYNTVNKSSY